ncbi:MAG: ABC transporter permease [Acidobacteria bacterium]|nr:ABC transporter permease [Acidobacteriota bacterium]
MDHLTRDLNTALRSLRRSPGFAVVVVLTLALGIGANTAIFTLLDQVVLRRLPVPAAEALVQLDGPGAFSGRSELGRAFSYPMFRDLSAGTGATATLMARAPASVVLRIDGGSERVSAEMLSGNTFDTLGVTPALGRFFTPADDTPGAPPVAVLSDDAWQRFFGRAPNVVGRSVVVNATPMTVAGVAPPGFTGIVTNESPALFVPITAMPAVRPTWSGLDDRRFRWLHIVARLAPGVDSTRAKAALDVRYRQVNDHELTAVPAFAALSDQFKTNFRNKTLVLTDASRGISEIRGALGTPALLLMGMVGLVLLIACANVANLLLARATGRQREMSVRLALGATRGRLVRQTLVESLVVAVAGGVVGSVLAVWLGDVLLAVLPLEMFNSTLATTPDLRIAGFTALVSLTTVLLFGLAPALRGSNVDVNRALKEEAAAAGGGVQHARLRKGLVVAQVALSTLLVASAALFAQSLMNLRTLGPGFDTDRIVSFALDATLSGHTPEGARTLYRTLGERLAALPGVQSSSYAAEAVLIGNVAARTVQVQGYAPQQGEDMNPWTNEVGPDYFRTLGIALVAGRGFTARDVDGAPRVAVVNETFATYFFGNESPLGRRFGFRSEADPGRWEIVGVVKDTAYSQVRPGEGDALDELAPGRDLGPSRQPRVVYTPFLQTGEVDELTFYMRAEAGAAAGLPALARAAVREADGALPVFRLTTMEATVNGSLAIERLMALLSLLFGVLATTLAAVGLYGVMSYTVARRTREIGVRIALGAARPQVLRMVLGEVAWLTVSGILLGLPAAWAAGRAAESQLFGLTPLDPVSLGGAATLLAAVGLLAGYLPARRAAGTPPSLALRTE